MAGYIIGSAEVLIRSLRLPEDLASLLDRRQFHALTREELSEVTRWSERLGVHLIVYGDAVDIDDHGHLCRMIEPAHLGPTELGQLAELESRLPTAAVLVAYERPVRLRHGYPPVEAALKLDPRAVRKSEADE